MFIGMIGSIIGIICLVTSYLIFSRYKNMLFKKLIKVSKGYELRLVFPEKNPTVHFINGKIQVDNVIGWWRRLFNFYVIGDNGYYVVSRLSGKIYTITYLANIRRILPKLILLTIIKLMNISDSKAINYT